MSGISKFTIKDYNQIRKEWSRLYSKAAVRCRDEEELAVVRKAFDFARLTDMYAAVPVNHTFFIPSRWQKSWWRR